MTRNQTLPKPKLTPDRDSRSNTRSPFACNPSVEKLQASLRLIERNHVSSGVNFHKCQVPITLHLSNLPSIIAKGQILEVNLVVGMFSRPIQPLGPRVIPQPVADEVGVPL